MPNLDRQSLAWMRDHHATISSTALHHAGIGTDERKHLVRTGTSQRVVDGAYAFTGVHPTELTRCAAIRTSRPQLVIAGPTAARLWAMRRAPSDGLVHVLAPPRSHPCCEAWIRAHRTALLSHADIVRRADGIRLTSPPRTVVDLTRYIDADAISSVIEDVLNRGLCTTATLQRVAASLATPGRPWARRFLAVLDGRHPGPAAESDAERRVLEALVARGVIGLERQISVDLPGYGLARFDLAIPELRWALEIDLHPEHTTPAGVARDNLRDDRATVLGWETRRVGAVEVAERFDSTIDRLVASIDRRRTVVSLLLAAGSW